MALNEGMSWAEVGVTVSKAFIQGKAEKKLLASGLKLYKFNTRGRELIYEGRVSPWWFPVDPLGDFDVGLEGVLKFAAANGVRSTEYARLIAAVTEEWNQMDVIMQVKLKDNVYGFWGQCANQPKKLGSKVNLTGRAYQLHIPNLTGAHVELLGKPVAAP